MSLPNGHGSPGGRSHFDRPDWRKCTEQPDCGCWVCLDKAGVSLPEARGPEERGDQKQTDESLVAELARLPPFEYDRKRKNTATAIGITVATLSGGARVMPRIIPGGCGNAIGHFAMRTSLHRRFFAGLMID
jgi:hypothetical protein